MEIITLDEQNIENEHICCAFSVFSIFYIGKFLSHKIMAQKEFTKVLMNQRG